MFYSSLLIPISHGSNEHLQRISSIQRILNNPDVHKIEPLEDKHSISIEQIHILQSSLGLKPYQENRRLVLITPADKLTLPAQQALLKTLEEPPAHIQMVLATDRPHVLLPTIRSRLHDLSEPDPVKPADNDGLLDEILRRCRTISGAIELAEEWGSDKETAISRLQELTVFLHHQKATARSLSQLEITRNALLTLKHIESNINTKLALENFLLKLTKLA